MVELGWVCGTSHVPAVNITVHNKEKEACVLLYLTHLKFPECMNTPGFLKAKS